MIKFNTLFLTKRDIDFLDTITLRDALLTVYSELTKEQKNKVITDGTPDGAKVTIAELVSHALYNDEDERNRSNE